MRLSWCSTRAYRSVTIREQFIADANISQQEINIQNMNVELVAQMFKNYQSNVLFHLEGKDNTVAISFLNATDIDDSNGQPT